MRFDYNPRRILESKFRRIPPNNLLMLPNPRVVFASIVATINVSAACLERDESILELEDIAYVMRE